MSNAWDTHKAAGRYTEFETWLDGVLAGQQLPQEVVAVNFNIYDGANETYEVELIGAPGFDEEDDDWACEELFASDLLSLPVTPETQEWEEGLADIISMVREYMDMGQFREKLESYEAVGVGHVNGSIEVVYRKPTLFEEAEAAEPMDTPDALPLFLAPEPQETPLPGMPLFVEAEVNEPPVPHPQPAPMQQPVPMPYPMPTPAPTPMPQAPPMSTPMPRVAPKPARMPSAAPAGPLECFKLIREVRPKNINCKPQREYGIRQYELLRAEPFTRWDPQFTLVYQAQRGDVATDLLSNSLGWLVVSSKLKALLEGLESQIEYFPVRVVEESIGQELPGYYVANLLRRQDALSLANSDYEVVNHPVFGTYNAVKKYALQADALGGADIFKLPKRQEIPVFVTSRFKARMTENGITGMAYYPVKMV